MTPARSALITAHSSLVGLTGAALADALIPTASAAVDLLSTCELEAAAGIRLAFGLPASAPYVPGGDHAARALYALADPDTGGTPWAPAGALRRPTLEEPPGVGDAIWYAPAAGGHPPEHVDGCVLEVEDAQRDHETDEYPSTLHLRAIAGGQPDGRGHSSAIAEVERVLLWAGGVWRCRATGRVVWCVVDADLMGRRYVVASV